MMTYEEIALSYVNNPRDVHTVKANGNIGRWFFTYTKDGVIYATTAKEHSPSSEMKNPIRVKKEQFQAMLSLYYKRLSGEKVSKEASLTTWAQVYWYGIFNDLGL